MLTSGEITWDFKHIRDNSYLLLKVELWGLYFKHFWKIGIIVMIALHHTFLWKIDNLHEEWIQYTKQHFIQNIHTLLKSFIDISVNFW